MRTAIIAMLLLQFDAAQVAIIATGRSSSWWFVCIISHAIATAAAMFLVGLGVSWPARRMHLWHPDSPGVRMDVLVRWPRYWWVRDRDPVTGRPRAFATTGEVLRRWRELERGGRYREEQEVR